MSDFKPVKPFRYWVQLALPQVYDDSLSYYELLNKVVYSLNILGENNNTLIASFTELKEYVEDYFANYINSPEYHAELEQYIDEQVNAIMSELISSGSIYNEVNDVAENMIPALVDAWLAAKIQTGEYPYVLDSSLTQSDAAAQAKAVGDRIGFLDSVLANLIIVPDQRTYNYKIGTISRDGTYDDSVTSRIRTTNFINTRTTSIWKLSMTNDNFRIIRVFKYPHSGSSSGAIKMLDVEATETETPGVYTFVNAPKEFTFVADNANPYLRLVVANIDPTHTMTSSDVASVTTDLIWYKITDDYLETVGAAADGHEVGSRFSAVQNNIDIVQSNVDTVNDSLYSYNRGADYLERDGTNSDGTDNPNQNRARTNYLYIPYPYRCRIYIDNDVDEGVPKYRIFRAYQAAVAGEPGIIYYSDAQPLNHSFIYEGSKDYPYFRMSISKENSSTVIAPSEISDIKARLHIEYIQPEVFADMITDAQRLGLHTQPDNVGVLNAIKNARQLTDVKWMPVTDIPRVCFVYNHIFWLDKFAANKEYVGVPYSQNITAKDHYIGTNVNIETFVTAANCEGSIFNTESVFEGNEAGASYYGNVCVHVPCYAFNLPTISSSAYESVPQFKSRFNGAVVSSQTDDDINSYRLCDILIIDGHVALITDIEKDDNGNVIRIEVSECGRGHVYSNHINGGAYGGNAIRKFWKIDDFKSYWGAYKIASFSDIGSVKYIPNEYVSVSEGNKIPVFDYPLLPEYGNKYCYRVNKDDSTFNAKILINALPFNVYDSSGNVTGTQSFTELRYKKNGTPQTAIQLDGDYVNVTCSKNEDAEYEAWLWGAFGTDSGHESVHVKWAVMTLDDTEGTISYSGSGTRTVTVSATRGSSIWKPKYAVCDRSTHQNRIAKIYDLEITKNGADYEYSFKFKIPSSYGNPNSAYIWGSIGDNSEYGNMSETFSKS